MNRSVKLLSGGMMASMLLQQVPLVSAEMSVNLVDVNLSLDQSSYEFGEAIQVDLSITNNSTEEISDGVLCDAENLLRFKSESEDDFHYLYETNCEAEFLLMIAAGETYEASFVIAPNELLEPGDWEIKTSIGEAEDIVEFTVEDRPYSDTEGHWAEMYISKLTVKNWLQGYPDGTFQPDQSMTRAEFLELVMNMAPLAVDFPTNHFWDVSQDDWFYDSVTQAEALGVIQGYSDKSFRPNEPITRAEALSILLNMMDFVDEASALEYADVFSDVSNDWTRPYILTAYEMGSIGGIESEDDEPLYFLPNTNITRGEAAKIVYLAQEMSSLETETTTYGLGGGVLSVDMCFENPADWDVQNWSSNEATFFNRNSGQYEYFGVLISEPETSIDGGWFDFPLLLKDENVEDYCPILLASEDYKKMIISCDLEKNSHGLDVVHLVTFRSKNWPYDMDGGHYEYSNTYFVDMQSLNDEILGKSYLGLVVSDQGWDGENYVLNQLVNSVDAYAWGE